VFKLKKKQLFLFIISILAVVGIVFFVSYTLSQESYAVSAFTKVGEHTWTVPDGVYSVDVLVVAVGGGGGYRHGAGGGAGGVLYTEKYNVSPGQIINVVVGAGGEGAKSYARSVNGGNSVFGELTAIGGGGAGQWDSYTQGLSGGSGGGSAALYNAAGTSGQGNAGGAGATSGSPYNWVVVAALEKQGTMEQQILMVMVAMDYIMEIFLVINMVKMVGLAVVVRWWS
jgi:hypothetical protein